MPATDVVASVPTPDLAARGPVPRLRFGNLTSGGTDAPQAFAGSPPREPASVMAGAALPKDQVADASGEIVATGGGSYQLNFESADVAAVSKAILNDILKVNYLVDKRVSGQISLTSSQPVPRARLLPLLESSLGSVGAAIVKDADLYRIVPSTESGGLGNVDYRTAGEGFGTTVITARYLPAATLATLLGGFGSKTVHAEPATNLVIVTGTANERRSAIEAAGAVDVDYLRSKSVAVLPVANSEPETMIGELNHILGTGEGGVSQDAVQFEPIKRLNAVLVVARRPDALGLVRRWVARLDRVDPSAAGVKVYRLQYAQAKSVAATLNAMFSGSSATDALDRDALEPSSRGATTREAPALTTAATAAGLGSAPGVGPQSGSTGSSAFGVLSASFGDAAKPAAAAAKAEPPKDAFGGGEPTKVRVAADVGSNSLFINASAVDYRLIERAIHQIDRAPVQVDIEATIAEVTLTKELQYGVQFFLQNNKMSLGLSGASNTPLSTASSALNLLAGAASNPRLLLSALQSFTTVKILSSPSLVVLDQQPAVLQVGDQVPILTQQAQSVSTSLSPVVNSVEYKDTGVILSVLPHVNANGVVTLDVEQQISSVANTDSATLTPTISQRRVRSSVAVANGQTVMLAGLISERQSDSRSGIPGVVSVKFLNDLLSAHDTALNRTEIIIFIKPTIISNAADAQQVTQEFRDRLVSMRRNAVR